MMLNREPNLNALRQFRRELYELIPKRADTIMNLIDALSSCGGKYKCTTQISLSQHFDRDYSSVTKAIDEFPQNEDWDAVERLMMKYSQNIKFNNLSAYLLDATPIKRACSKVLPDRSIVHFPNPAPGNAPITTGHQYSFVVKATSSAEKNWSVPLESVRIASHENASVVGIEQILRLITNKAVQFPDDLDNTISVSDRAYGSILARKKASESDRLIHIFRLRNNRNFYKMVQEDSSVKRRGAKQRYGSKMSLKCDEDWRSPDKSVCTSFLTKKGQHKRHVQIDYWDDLLLRGDKEFRGFKNPVNVIRVTVRDEDGNLKFKNPLWVAVTGKERASLSALEVYDLYLTRYDIEHFFRYGKQRLLLNSFQTPSEIHQQSWHNIVILAYFQLFLARNITTPDVYKWHKTLPSYKRLADNPGETMTLGFVQSGFSDLLDELGTPAATVKKRGRAPGRKKGDIQEKRQRHKLVVKGKKNTGVTSLKTIFQQFEKSGFVSKQQKIDRLPIWFQNGGAKLGIEYDELLKALNISP